MPFFNFLSKKDSGSSNGVQNIKDEQLAELVRHNFKLKEKNKRLKGENLQLAASNAAKDKEIKCASRENEHLVESQRMKNSEIFKLLAENLKLLNVDDGRQLILAKLDQLSSEVRTDKDRMLDIVMKLLQESVFVCRP